MPIIPQVGRKQPRMRLAIALVYGLLILGGIAMVVPFCITLTLSVANYYEHDRFDIYPRYLFSAKERYLKYLAQRYDFWELFPDFRSVYEAPPHWGSFRDIAYDENAVDEYFPLFGEEERRPDQLRRVAEDYLEFLADYDIENCKMNFSAWNMPRYQTFLLEKYGRIYLEENKLERGEVSLNEYERGAMETMGRIAGTSYRSIHTIMPYREYHAPFDLQAWFQPDSVLHKDYIEFMRTRPVAERMPITRHYLWTKFLFNKDVQPDTLDWSGGASPYRSVFQIPFVLEDKALPLLRELRRDFIQEYWPVRLVRLDPGHAEAFRAFAREQLPSIEELNDLAGTDFADFDSLPFHPEAMQYPQLALRSLWRDYALTLPRDQWQLLTPETEYQRFLIEKYGSLEAVNQAYGWQEKDLRSVRLPIAESDYWHYASNKGKFLVGFLTKNYAFTIHFLRFRGRAVWNTIVLVFFSILTALTVNPLAAYALSRFRPRQTHQILIFLLAVMAFPPMVAAIPAFLLLRDLGLLNTYAALILPGMANGYAIFLLKGFFDSLPQELYEAAAIDGAREWMMFARITMPLCKPILAVIALNTFIIAYGGFLWALIVCQDERMWTLMVWMMQFHSSFAWMPFMTTAGMVLVSIPTLLVFVFCQKIILRGIVIPQMK